MQSRHSPPPSLEIECTTQFQSRTPIAPLHTDQIKQVGESESLLAAGDGQR